MPDHQGIVAIGSMLFAGFAAVLTAWGAIRSKRDQSDREDEEQNEQDLTACRARLRHAQAHIDTLTNAAFRIRHEAARRLMNAGDTAPLPEVPVYLPPATE